MKRYVVTLTEEEREALGALASRGKHRSQRILNALILLGCDAGDFQTERSTNEEIARVLSISMRKIDRAKKRFVIDGLDICLNGRKGWVIPPEHNSSFATHASSYLGSIGNSMSDTTLVAGGSRPAR